MRFLRCQNLKSQNLTHLSTVQTISKRLKHCMPSVERMKLRDQSLLTMDKDVQIREMSPEETPQLADLIGSSLLGDHSKSKTILKLLGKRTSLIWMVFSPEVFRTSDLFSPCGGGKSRRTWVGVCDGRVVGSVTLLRHSDRVGELCRMRVGREHQGRGVGRRLVGHLEEYCRDDGVKQIVLTTSEYHERAIRLYRRCGYIRDNKGDYSKALFPGVGDPAINVLTLRLAVDKNTRIFSSSAALVLAVLPATVLGLSAEEIAAFQARTHTETNSGKQGTVSITQDGDALVLTSNGIPDHATGTYPELHIPYPSDAHHGVHPRLPGYGPIGMAVNGVPIFNPFNINCQDAVENEVLDSCDGHPAQRGDYHYHHEANCLPDNAMGDSGASGIVGVAFDGIAIYGPRKEDGTLYVHDDLDACHGITVNGTYRYHMTSDFPYFIGCYHGELLTNSGANTRCECDVQQYLAGDSSTVTSSVVTLTAATGLGLVLRLFSPSFLP
uniref:N-acetyltransferase domain-containing protein n=1 Tax=Branchiostoma floridae TaxID=7739 RepID=C3YCZ0_BRAFL|eukprot:XP_002605931.1 hypothetical protein BRAFLDRAFT_124891 [Branchiostoma floridae]